MVASRHDDMMHYEYHHGTGKHILVRKQTADDDPNRPRISCACILHNLLDALILLICLAFLGGAGYLCYYLLTNYGNGN